jgi:uncharacterized protein with gpF-like domain
MGKTYRKSKNGIKYNDGNLKHPGVRYNCRCEYCMCDQKVKNKEKLADKQIKEVFILSKEQAEYTHFLKTGELIMQIGV